ncbi:MAG TPA: DUF1365 domain-containing protein [Bacteroidia bacterium]|jgi:DUF1365 family protein|nr:DUF1365 domain-containing protein [Bacteroidia bacterium]
MKSCLYKARVMHHRLEPKKHSFHYNVFMFYLCLEELDQLRLKLMSRNRFNLFTFKDKEHLQLPRENPDTSKTIREQIVRYLSENGISEAPARIMLLTNLSTLGYNFNPVSFYFCFDEQNQPICSIAEISNTFREMKPYLILNKTEEGKIFQLDTPKNFYVSPFFDHDTRFQFNLHIPSEKLNIRVDDLQDDRKIFISTLTGTQKPLTDSNLLRYFCSIPFITLKVITLIHWNAMLLWMKKIPYRKKAERMDLQQGVYKPYKD